jgi:hypothetical protein
MKSDELCESVLRTLLHLPNEFAMEDFDTLRRNAMTALTVTSPEISAKYAFHTCHICHSTTINTLVVHLVHTVYS